MAKGSGRGFFIRIVIGLGITIFAAPVMSQSYPSQSVRMIVGDPPGGVTDLAARIIQTKLAESLGQQVIIENRPGGTGAIAATLVARATPDGYTLFMSNSGSLVMNPFLQPNLQYDPIKSFTHVAPISASAFAVAVHPSVPAKDLRELIALVRESPDKFSYASSGNGTVPQLLGEWIKSVAKVTITHVPYKGGAAAMQDLVAGHIPIGMVAVSAAQPNARAGRIRVLAVSTTKRLPFELTWPTIEETFPGVTSTLWVGLVAPAGTPREVVLRLNGAIQRILREADIRERFNAAGAEVMPGPPEGLLNLIRDESQSYLPLVRQLNIRSD